MYIHGLYTYTSRKNMNRSVHLKYRDMLYCVTLDYYKFKGRDDTIFMLICVLAVQFNDLQRIFN